MEFGLGFFVGGVDDDEDSCDEFDAGGLSAFFDEKRFSGIDDLAGFFGKHAGEKHGFGVLGCEVFAGFARAGLEEKGGALGRGVDDAGSSAAEVLACVVDGVDTIGVGVDSGLFVRFDCVVFPAAFEKLVYHFEELIGNFVSIIVLCQLVQTIRFRSTFQIARDDIPAYTALRNMIERSVSSRKLVWMLIARGRSDSERDVLGRICHCRDQ